MNIFFWLMIAGLVVTFFTLFYGLFTMTHGKDFNQRYGNKIMWLRISAQLFTVLMFILFLVG